jgi:hypothetical protein
MNKKLLLLAIASLFIMAPATKLIACPNAVSDNSDLRVHIEQQQAPDNYSAQPANGNEQMRSDYATRPTNGNGSAIRAESRSDADMTKAVTDAIHSDKSLSAVASSIDVKAENGTITLSGTVDSDKTKSDIESKAKSIVRDDSKVVDNIVVAKAATPASATPTS